MLVRLIVMLFRNRIAMIVVGVIIMVVGLGYGSTSQQVSYIQSSATTNYELATGTQSGNLYIHATGSSDYFVAFSSDFQVPRSDLDSFSAVSFIARSDTSTLDPALNAPDGSTVTEAHKIEKLVLTDKNDNTLGTFTTSEYNTNPNGVYVNNWPAGLVILVVGLLLIVVSFVIRRQKQPQGFSVSPAGMGQQSMYGQPPANPYGQPDANPYAQPNPNPYAQPYQGPPPAGQPYNPYPPNPPYPPPPQQ